MEQIEQFLGQELITLGSNTITVGQMIAVPLVLAFGFLLARWAIRFMGRRLQSQDLDKNLIQVITRAAWLLVIVTLLFSILGLLNVPLTALAFLSGAIAIGVGFGAQNVIGNFISGWILMGERPIRIGDLVEISGTLGVVETIQTRATRIRRLDGVHIVIPNSHLLENVVINWTLVDNEIRNQVRVGVAYGSPVVQVKELIEQVLAEHSDVLTTPPPAVIFEDFGDDALIFDAFFFTNLRPGGDLRMLRSKIRFRINELFAEHGIVIAFPQRDVHIDGKLQIENAANAPGSG